MDLHGEDLEPKRMNFGVSEEEKVHPDDRTKRVGTGAFMAPEVVDLHGAPCNRGQRLIREFLKARAS